MFNFMSFGDVIGVDLGTSNILSYTKEKGIVIQEPSVVAINNKNNKIIAVGEEARLMIGRTHEDITAIRPLKKGVICNVDATEKILQYLIERTINSKAFVRPTIGICVPSGVTNMEKRSMEEATRRAGAREVHIIEEPIAAAIGSGVDISKIAGNMIINIGGGTSDIAVISLGGIVVSKSIKVAGDNFDDAIIKYMRKNYNLLIGEHTAQALKFTIGTADENSIPVNTYVKGRNNITGLPSEVLVSSSEMFIALKESIELICDSVHSVLEKTPPELVSDIMVRGIIMTGGGSLLYGLDKLIEKRTGVRVVIAQSPITCVAIGTGRYIDFMSSKNKIK